MVALSDVSLGGAALLCEWPCDIGAEVLVGLPGANDFVSARIVTSCQGLLAVAFRQDETTLKRVGITMEGLRYRIKQAA